MAATTMAKTFLGASLAKAVPTAGKVRKQIPFECTGLF